MSVQITITGNKVRMRIIWWEWEEMEALVVFLLTSNGTSMHDGRINDDHSPQYCYFFIPTTRL